MRPIFRGKITSFKICATLPFFNVFPRLTRLTTRTTLWKLKTNMTLTTLAPHPCHCTPNWGYAPYATTVDEGSKSTPLIPTFWLLTPCVCGGGGLSPCFATHPTRHTAHPPHPTRHTYAYTPTPLYACTHNRQLTPHASLPSPPFPCPRKITTIGSPSMSTPHLHLPPPFCLPRGTDQAGGLTDSSIFNRPAV